MSLSLSSNDLSAFVVSEDNKHYLPPRATVAVTDTDFPDKKEVELVSWLEVHLKIDQLDCVQQGCPQLLLTSINDRDSDNYLGETKGEEQKLKTVLFSQKHPGNFVAFIPPGRYRSIQFGFGNNGASFSEIQIIAKAAGRAVTSIDFLSAVGRRTKSLFLSPNPETARRFDKTKSALISLLRGLKDDLVGVKPQLEIPDGPYEFDEYDIWFEKNCAIGLKEELLAGYFISTFNLKPLISVVLSVYNADPRLLAGSIHSVLDQLYSNIELVISDDCSTSQSTLTYLKRLEQMDSRIKVNFSSEHKGISDSTNKAIDIANGDYVAFLEQGDLLTRDAIFWVVEKINEWPSAELLYSDEDRIDEHSRFTLPHFKSDWNLLLLLSHNYIEHLLVVKRELAKIIKLRKEFDGSHGYDFLLRASTQIDESHIKHIPRILYHWRFETDYLNQDLNYDEGRGRPRREAALEFLANWSPGATIDNRPTEFYNRIHFPVPNPPPKVAIVVPTRDTPEVLERCINSLVNFTNYPNYEIHIIDNGSTEARTKSLFRQLESDHKVSVHSYDKPFNYSAMHNWLIGQLETELVCLLNNDTEIVESNWLNELVSLVSLPGFGAAGSLLLYPDRTVQHAGVTLGIGGIAGHIGVGDRLDDPSYYSRRILPQELSAVTAACLVLKVDLYKKVGGMNAERLPISFNDVDLCLKIRGSGAKIAWTPFSKLIHYESKSRGLDHENELKRLRSAGEMSYCALTWRSEIQNDPYYNPNFDLESEPFAKLASVPRLELTLKPDVKS